MSRRPAPIPAGLGPGTTSTGTSWDPGGACGHSSGVSSDTGAITGPRSSDGSPPAARGFLVPRNGTAIGVRP